MFMSSEEIKKIQVGDQVAYDHSSWTRVDLKIGRVVKITPTGRIRIDNGMLFGTNGREITSDIRASHLVEMEYYNTWKESIDTQKEIKVIVAKINDMINGMKLEELKHLHVFIEEMKTHGN